MENLTPIQVADGGKLTFIFAGSDEEIGYMGQALMARFPQQDVAVVGGVTEVIYEPPATYVHSYTSTACQHQLHAACRRLCKFCDTACRCGCHMGGD